MAANSPLLRTLGIAAGGLGCFQAFTWGILSLLGILVYADVITLTITGIPSNRFKETLVPLYFTDGAPDEDIMDPGTVVVWTSLYFATSVIWLVISGFLLYDFCVSKFTSYILIGWVAVTAVVSVIDFAGAVAFGVDYNSLQRSVDINPTLHNATDILLAPILLMTMCARGFVLWLMNVGMVIYLGMAASKLNKKDPVRVSNNSLCSLPAADSYSRGRQNTAFQPEPIVAWGVQSPTVGNMQRSPWNFPQNNSPHLANDELGSGKIFPRVAMPVSTPVVPVAPLPIPQPDYSPPLGRPIKHEPNLYDSPLRSALKKPNQYGRTIL